MPFNHYCILVKGRFISKAIVATPTPTLPLFLEQLFQIIRIFFSQNYFSTNEGEMKVGATMKNVVRQCTVLDWVIKIITPFMAKFYYLGCNYAMVNF